MFPNWGAEYRMSVQYKIPGGVLGDAIGYGKVLVMNKGFSAKSDGLSATFPVVLCVKRRCLT